VSEPLVAYRIHPGNKTLDVAGMREDLALMEQSYGRTPDWGAIHHYLAWVYLRSARRMPALWHFAQAALHGSLLPVGRSLAAVASRHLPFPVPGAAPHDGSTAWYQSASEWLDRVGR
jgi:hypothetical protein